MLSQYLCLKNIFISKKLQKKKRKLNKIFLKKKIIKNKKKENKIKK